MTRIAPVSGSFHPGDVSASPTGVFVSDSQNGAVYRLAANGYSLSPVVAPGIGKSAQGSAASPDGQSLIVADYSQGVGTGRSASGTRTLLPRQDGKPLRGIDGMTRCGDVYYGIYNGSDAGHAGLDHRPKDDRSARSISRWAERLCPTRRRSPTTASGC